MSLGAFVLALFGGYAALTLIPFRGREGQQLLFYLLVDEEGWKLLLFLLCGICLTVALACQIPPPVNRVRWKGVRWGLKAWLGLLYLAALAVWSLFSLFLLPTASTWSYSSYSDTEGHRVLVRWQSYGVEIWTPYAGLFYQEFQAAPLTDMDAVTTNNCPLAPGDAGLVLSCGQDLIRILGTNR